MEAKESAGVTGEADGRRCMPGSWLVVARVLLGWFGVALIVGGVWIATATSVTRRTGASGRIVGGGVSLVGALIVWGAFSLP